MITKKLNNAELQNVGTNVCTVVVLKNSVFSSLICNKATMIEILISHIFKIDSRNCAIKVVDLNWEPPKMKPFQHRISIVVSTRTQWLLRRLLSSLFWI